MDWIIMPRKKKTASIQTQTKECEVEKNVKRKSVYVCTVNCDTDNYTNELILSVRKHIKSLDIKKIIVFDNSRKNCFKLSSENKKFGDVEVLSNVNKYVSVFDELLEFNRKQLRALPSIQHTKTIQWFIDNLDEDFVLFDNDCVLKRDVDFVDDRYITASDIMFEKFPRCIPFIQYFNLTLIKKYGLRYFDSTRMARLPGKDGRCVYPYDTGSSFYEDIIKTYPNEIKIINYSDYVWHRKSGSLDGNIIEYPYDDNDSEKNEVLVEYDEGLSFIENAKVLDFYKSQIACGDTKIVLSISENAKRSLEKIQLDWLKSTVEEISYPSTLQSERVSKMINSADFNMLKYLKNSYWCKSYVLRNYLEYNKKNICVYTCITGKYDELEGVSWNRFSDIEHICFTDNKEHIARGYVNGWKIVKIPEELTNLEQVLQQRAIKIMPHKWLPEYDYTLWIDGNTKLNCRDVLVDFIQFLDPRKPVWMKNHPDRNCVYAEADICRKMGKDLPRNINRIVKLVEKDGYPSDNGLVESGIMFRNNMDESANGLMDAWWNAVKSYTKRDQLSFNYVCWKEHFNYSKLNDVFSDIFSSNNGGYRFISMREHARRKNITNWAVPERTNNAQGLSGANDPIQKEKQKRLKYFRKM